METNLIFANLLGTVWLILHVEAHRIDGVFLQSGHTIAPREALGSVPRQRRKTQGSGGHQPPSCHSLV